MSAVTLFDFKSSPVRVVERDGAPWFVARDVAELLGYANTREAILDNCKGGSEQLLPSAGGAQLTKIIPERDVYRLILRSKLPAAEEFEEWVVGTVLPSIRKNGGYVAGQHCRGGCETPPPPSVSRVRFGPPP